MVCSMACLSAEMLRSEAPRTVRGFDSLSLYFTKSPLRNHCGVKGSPLLLISKSMCKGSRKSVSVAKFYPFSR